MARLFISQERIDRWASEGKISLTDDVMTLPALGASFRLTPAYFVVRIVSENDDRHGLLNKVKSHDSLVELGADVYATSILLGEVAYECEPGFLGEVVGAAG